MATITPSVSPGSYLEAQTVSFSFSADITSVALTKNAAPPSISKYIAYDTLTPANPFLAVTEDGRGRVVYDGGFPKFYNLSNPATPANFAELTPAGKYLHNAIKWVANPTKVAAGNKKVLVIGDGMNGDNYPVKSTESTGFYNTIHGICAVAGHPVTFIDLSDFGGSTALLNPALGDLEKYCCVIFFGTRSTDKVAITTQAVNDLVTYRENGNGLIFITDHGYDLNSIADVNLGVGSVAFFKTINMVVSRFGAYFTGTYDRTPVNVGFLRANYGDHPLYAGLTNAEDVAAGGSESKVVVTQTTMVAPNSLAPVLVNTSGLNTINVLATVSDGSVITARIVYIIQGDEFVFLRSNNPTSGLLETNQGVAYSDLAGRMNFSLGLDAGNLGTVWGEVLLRGKRIGEVHGVGANSYFHFYAGSADKTPVRHGDVVQVVVSVPFTYSKSLTVNRPEFTRNRFISLASAVEDIRKTVKTLSTFNSMDDAMKVMHEWLNGLLPASFKKSKPTSLVKHMGLMHELAENKLQLAQTLTATIYGTTVAAQAAVAAVAANPGTVIIDAQTNTVYAYKSGTIQAIAGLKAQDFFGSPRLVTSTVDSKVYRLETNGTITLVP